MQKEPREYYDEYKKTRRPIYWNIPDVFKSSKEVTYRDKLGEHLQSLKPEDIVVYYAYHSYSSMNNYKNIFQKYASLKGVGLELGAGCGVMSTVFARDPEVNFILSVEVVDSLTERIIPKVSKGYLGENFNKVVPVIGTFDDLEVQNNSIDFIIEIDSLHHSHNLKQTFAESYRVLKPGGVMIFMDRCHPNSLTDQRVKEMLDVVYSKEWLEHNFYPLDMALTRRENGENEYRLYEWEDAIKSAGFKIEMLKKMYQPISFKKAVRTLAGFIRDSVFKRRKPNLKEFKIYLSHKLGIEMNIEGEFVSLPYSQRSGDALFVLRK